MTALERARLNRKWTRRELADKAGVSYPTILNAESGESAVTDSTLFKLADALEVEPSDLRDPDGSRAAA